MKHILNTNQDLDFTKFPLFFGNSDGLSIQRYDKFRYDKIFNMFKQHISYFWRPEEVNISKDKGDFELALSYHQESLDIFNKNYQAVHPSIAETLNNMAVVYENKGD